MGNLVASNRVTSICHSLLRLMGRKKKRKPHCCLLWISSRVWGFLFYFACFAFIWSAFSALFSVSPRHILIWLAKKKRKVHVSRPDGMCVIFSSLRKSLYLPLLSYILKAGLQSPFLENHYLILKFPLNNSAFCWLLWAFHLGCLQQNCYHVYHSV